MHRSVKTHANTTTVIPTKEGVTKGIKALNHRGTKATNIHDDDWSPSVMKALATESRRHGGKAFFSSPCASVAIFFHGKDNHLFLEDAIYVCAVSQMSKSPVREICTPGSEGVGVAIGSSFYPVLRGWFPWVTRLTVEVGNGLFYSDS